MRNLNLVIPLRRLLPERMFQVRVLSMRLEDGLVEVKARVKGGSEEAQATPLEEEGKEVRKPQDRLVIVCVPIVDIRSLIRLDSRVLIRNVRNVALSWFENSYF